MDLVSHGMHQILPNFKHYPLQLPRVHGERPRRRTAGRSSARDRTAAIASLGGLTWAGSLGFWKRRIT